MLETPSRHPHDAAVGTHPVTAEPPAALLAVGERVLGDWLGRRLVEAQGDAEREVVQHDVVMLRTVLQDSACGTACDTAHSLGDRGDGDLARLLELVTHLSAQLIREAADAALAQGIGTRLTGAEAQALPIKPTVAAVRRLRTMTRDVLVILKARSTQAATPNCNR